MKKKITYSAPEINAVKIAPESGVLQTGSLSSAQGEDVQNVYGRSFDED